MSLFFKQYNSLDKVAGRASWTTRLPLFVAWFSILTMKMIMLMHFFKFGISVLFLYNAKVICKLTSSEIQKDYG